MATLTMENDHKEQQRKHTTTHHQSLLAQALDIPSLNHYSPYQQEQQQPPQHQEQQHEQPTFKSEEDSALASSSYNTSGNLSSSFGLAGPFLGLPRHSDFTIPTSNTTEMTMDDGPPSPPDLLVQQQQGEPQQQRRRSVFGEHVTTKYGTTTPFIRVESSETLETDNAHHDFYHNLPSSSSSLPSSSMPRTPPSNNTPLLAIVANRNISDLTPPSTPSTTTTTRQDGDATLLIDNDLVSPLTPYNGNRTGDSCTEDPSHSTTATTTAAAPAHETLHIQSLILGFAFMAIWSPQNIMAPNLTEIANDFGFDAEERDLYLGSFVALATGVLSLPISAGIGILTDVYDNRKYLYCATVAFGGLFSFATGASQNFKMLFLARLFNGGVMSGSVPVAFSLLGDLFDTHERNAASSGLTAMMGVGIVAGQVYAGVVGSTLGWPHAFYVSALWTCFAALLVLVFVKEPIRGGKETVLQDMIRQGTRYERKLSWDGFTHAMRHNKSNSILMWQGFFSSVPWGIIFVFLNDYLSQERGFSVPDATYLVFVFGIGCAVGGVLGGWWGQIFMQWNRSYLPLFMAVTTFLGIFPFLALLDGSFTNAHGFEAVFFSFMGGLVASLPSVNVRPCIINVNPPETRGAALTAANLIINVARGAGPSCITLMGAIWGVNRKFSFNVTMALFWVVAAIQLCMLAQTLPRDQDTMETELAEYAEARMQEMAPLDEEGSIVSIEDRITSFDAGAARESIQFMGEAFREISDEIRFIRPLHHPCQEQKAEEDEEKDAEMDKNDFERRRKIWIERQRSPKRDTGATDGDMPRETTPLL